MEISNGQFEIEATEKDLYISLDDDRQMFIKFNECPIDDAPQLILIFELIIKLLCDLMWIFFKQKQCRSV